MIDLHTAPLLPLSTRSLPLSQVPRELAFTREPRAKEALALINERYALEPLSEEEVELRRMALAHDQVDRSHERFSLACLERLAATLPGKPVLAHHDKRSWPLGRFYAAELSRDAATGATWLVARWYLLKSPENEALRRQIDAGIVSHVSIGFRGGVLICDLCGEPFWSDCPHWPGQEVMRDDASVTCTMTWTDPRGTAEAVEGSLVWLGAQQGAQVIKELEEMDDLKTLKERLDAWEARCQALEPLAADGQLYRDDLVAEVKRLAGILDAGREADVVCDALKEAGAAALKRTREEYQRRVDARFPPTGTGIPAAGDDKEVRVRQSAGGSSHPRAHTLI